MSSTRLGSRLGNRSVGLSHLQVWVHPGRGVDARPVVRALHRRVRLLDLARTGSAQVDVAVLVEPELGELPGLAEALPGTGLVVLAAAPSARLRAAVAARGAILLSEPSREQLLGAVTVAAAGTPAPVPAAFAS